MLLPRSSCNSRHSFPGGRRDARDECYYVIRDAERLAGSLEAHHVAGSQLVIGLPGTVMAR